MDKSAGQLQKGSISPNTLSKTFEIQHVHEVTAGILIDLHSFLLLSTWYCVSTIVITTQR